MQLTRKRPRLRTLAIAAVAVALTAGACGTTNDTSGGASSSSGSSGSTAAAPAKTGPIELGFMVSRASNAAAFGGELSEKVDQTAIYKALVDAQNKKGGLHGRQITPVFKETDSASDNFEADVAAACATFTEDHHVEAVVGRISDLFDSFESCLNKQQIPHIASTPEAHDATFMAQYPYLVDATSLTLDQRTRLKVDYGVSSGILKPSDKIGVVFAGCPASQRSWDDDALPYFKSKGLDVASVFETGCPAGAADAVAEVGKIPNLILQFRDAGVDKLYFHADELAALFIIASIAETQDWHPSYYVSTMANTAVVGSQIPPAQAANVAGLGWSPASDVATAQWPAMNQAATDCLALLKGEGIVPQTPLDDINAFVMCDTFSLLVEAVDASDGRVDGPSVAAAIAAMGTKHKSAFTYDGTSSYGPDRQTGVATAYPYAWDTGCSCLKYSGNAVTAP